MGSLRGQLLSESECCGCCCSCGSTNLTLEANVAHIDYGKSFRVRGSLDSALSKTAINNFKVVLREFTVKVASSGRTRKREHDYVLYDARRGLR
jgi:hypothetical protein